MKLLNVSEKGLKSTISKQIIAVLLALVLLNSIVFAEETFLETEDNETIAAAEPIEPAAEGEEEAAEAGRRITAQLRRELKMQTAEGVQQLIQERRQLLEQEAQGIENAAKQRSYQNQNQVRLSVHSLLDMKELIGAIGKAVSTIARDFNNSIQATLRAEERIESRGKLKRFFAGGDHEAAEEIEEEIGQNRERIKQLEILKEKCECEAAVKAMLNEQIQNMNLEQLRLEALAQKEKSSKGLLGWIWK